MTSSEDNDIRLPELGNYVTVQVTRIALVRVNRHFSLTWDASQECLRCSQAAKNSVLIWSHSFDVLLRSSCLNHPQFLY